MLDHNTPSASPAVTLRALCGLTAVFAIVFLLPQTLLSQNPDTPLRITTSFSSLVSDEVPFWFEHNQFGIYSRDANQSIFRMNAGFSAPFSSILDDLHFYSGIDLTGRIGGISNERPIHQLFAGLSYNNWDFYIGAKEERTGTVFLPLSAGPTIWSGNAKPMYKIKLQLIDYTPLPYTNGWFQVKGAYSHGWFENERIVQNAFLHEKYVFARLGKEGLPMIYGGLIHQGMWGGYDPIRFGKIPTSFRDYIRIIFGKEGGKDSPQMFQNNSFGNSLGAWEWGLQWIRPRWELLLNKSTIFEDGSGLWIRSPEDGVQGLTFRWFGDENKTTETAFTWEFWHTKSQSGPGPQDKPPGWEGDTDEFGNPFGGRDDYFNHSVYKNGWSRYGRTIGTPLITFDPVTGRMVNNRVVAHHFGVLHKSNHWEMKILYTWSNNHGTYFNPLPEPLTQNYFLLYLEKDLGYGFTGVTEAAIDRGSFSGNRKGFRIGMRYSM